MTVAEVSQWEKLSFQADPGSKLSSILWMVTLPPAPTRPLFPPVNIAQTCGICSVQSQTHRNHIPCLLKKIVVRYTSIKFTLFKYPIFQCFFSTQFSSINLAPVVK